MKKKLRKKDRHHNFVFGLAAFLILFLVINCFCEQPLITYPRSNMADKEKLAVIYSTLEQMRLEHNRVGEIAKNNWPEHQGQWAAYTKIFRAKQLILLREQNRLKEKIRKANYTDKQWKELTLDERASAEIIMYGDKQKLKDQKTTASSASLDQLKAVDFFGLEGQFVDPVEDFTTFQEDDSYNVVSSTSSRMTVTNVGTDEEYHTYKSYGSGHFGDFEHLVTVYFDTINGNYEAAGIWAVANTHGTRDDLDTASDGIVVYEYNARFYLAEYMGWQAEYLSGVSEDTPYYLTIERSGSDVTLYVYTDAGRTSLLGTVSLSSVPTTAFEYLQGVYSYGTSEGDDVDFYVENLDLQEEANIEYVNGAQAYANGSATSIAAAAANHTAGNLLVVFAKSDYASDRVVSGITDTAGNTYTYINRVASTNGDLEVWYAKNIIGHASNVVTATFTGDVSWREIQVLQYSGCDKDDPYDVSGTGYNTSAVTSQSTAAATTRQADEVIVAGYSEVVSTGQSFTAGANFTKRLTVAQNDFQSEDRIVSSTDSYGSSMTVGVQSAYLAIHATFKKENDSDITTGLVGYWPLNENPAIHDTTVADYSGQGNDGTLSTNDGSTNKSVTGQTDQAITFDGSDDYAYAPDLTNGTGYDFSAGASFTIAAWIKPATNGSGQGIVIKEGSSGPNYAFEIALWGSSGQLGLNKGDGGSTLDVLSSAGVSAGVWSHVAVVKDGTTITFYINGNSSPGDTSWDNMGPTSGTLNIGQKGSYLYSSNFSGPIDEVRIYNRALSQDDITELYNYTVSPDITSGLVGHWPLDENPAIQDTTVVDYSGQGNDGTLSTNDGSTNKSVTGQIGQALDFDGSDDNVQLPDSAVLVPLTYTISAWFKGDDVSPDTAQHIVALHYNDVVVQVRNSLLRGWGYDSGGVLVQGVTTLNDDTWYHVTFSYDGITYRLYLNGLLENSIEDGVSWEGGTSYPRIGMNANDSYPFDGLIDDVRVYNRALTQTDITELYNPTAPSEITIVQTTNVAPGSTGTTIPLVLDSQPSVGNLLVAFCGNSDYNEDRTVSAPDGTWTKIEDATYTNEQLTVWWKVVQSGDGTDYTFTVSGSAEYHSGVLYEIQGADTTSPINQSDIDTNTQTSPTVTPTVIGTLALAALGTNDALDLTGVSSGWSIDEEAKPTYHGTYGASRDALTTDTTTGIFNVFTLSSGADSPISATVLITPAAAAAATITIGDGTTPEDKDVAPESTNNAVNAFTLATDSGTDTVTGLTVTFTGTDVNDVAASGVKIYEDSGSEANEWDADDTLKGTASFSGSTASVTVSISVDTSATQYLVTYNIATGAGESDTLQGAITAASANSTIVNNDTTDATLTISGSCRYFYRRQITINSDQVSGSSNLTNFPAVVSLSGDWLKTTATDPIYGRIENHRGYDIIFKDSTGTIQLDHEIEDYDGSASGGTLVAWVRIPTLDYDDDTVIYMYYGNPCITTSQENINGVWDSNYKGVWHLNEISGGSGITETGNANNGGTSSSPSITHGLTINQGDVVIAVVHVDDSGNNIYDDNGAYAFTEAFQEDSADTSHYAIYYRVAGTSEPSSYSWDCDLGVTWSVLLRVFSGVDPSDVWDVAPSTSTRTSSSSSSTTATTPTMVTSNDGAMGLCIFLSDSNANATWSDPTNDYGTEVENNTRPVGSYIRRWEAAGDTGATSATLSEANDRVAHQIALKPDTSTSGHELDSTSNSNHGLNAWNAEAENFDDITDWTDDSEGTHTVEESPSGQLHLLAGDGTGTYSQAEVYKAGLAYEGDSSYAIEFRVKFDTLANFTNRDNGIMVAGGNYRLGNDYIWVIEFFADRIHDYNNDAKIVDRTINTGQWYTYRLVVTDDDDVAIYENGTYVATANDIGADYDMNDSYLVLTVYNYDASPVTTEAHFDWVRASTETSGFGATRTDGRIDGSLDFDGSDDYVEITNESDFDFASGDVSVSAWIYSKASQPAYAGIVSKYQPSGEGQTAWSFQYDDAEKAVFEWNNGGTYYYAETNSSIPQGEWTHVVGEVEGTTIKFYVDGTLQDTTDQLGGRQTNDHPVWFGREGDDDARFQGTIDEVHISDTSRKIDWIQTEYNNQKPNSTFYSVEDEQALCAYSYRKPITIQASQVIGSSDLTDFPALISLSGDWLKTTDADPANGHIKNANGYDIIFKNSSGTTQLDHEIEDFDGSASGGKLVAWVRIPTLSYNADTVIYMYYGNSCINSSQENVTGVWDNNYMAVWHLSQTPDIDGGTDEILDSKGDNDGDSQNMTSGNQVSGRIDGSLDFDGNNEYVDVPDDNSLDATNITLSAWVKSETSGRYIIAKDPIAYVNGAQGYNTGSGTSISSAAANHTTGNLLVVFVASASSTPNVSGIADTAGNTYTKINAKADGTTGDVEVWYAKNIIGNASNVVTATYTGSFSYRAIQVLQYSGCDTTDPYDVSNTGSGTGGSQSTAASTTTQADEVIVAAYWEANESLTFTAGTGFTKRLESSHGDLCAEDRIVTSTGSYGSSITVSPSVAYVAVHATFKMATPLKDVPYALSTVDGGQFRFISGGTTYNATSTTDINDSAWHHIVGTYDGSSMKIFIDGSLETTNTDPSGNLPTNTGNVRIGADYATTPANYFTGTIDEVRISDFARTAEWIETEYNNQKDNSTFYDEGDEEDLTDCSYSYNKEITIDSDQVMGTSDLTDFPLLINISSDNDLRTTTNNGYVENIYGYDIIFKDSSGNKLDHEIEDYEPTSGKFVAWVRIPTLDYDDDTVIYIYYGNACIISSQENVSGVWDDNYMAVWHLCETPDTDGGTNEILDSNNSNHGDSQDMTSGDQVSGRIDGSLSFDGSDKYVNVPHDASIDFADESFSYSMWIKGDIADNITQYGNRVFSKGTSSGGCGNGKRYELYVEGYDGADNIYFVIDDAANDTKTQRVASDYLDTTWHYITYTRNVATNEIKVYLDGDLDGTTDTDDSGDISNGCPVLLDAEASDDGGVIRSGRCFNGTLDEFRISDIPRSADWIKTEYNNQKPNSTFYTIGEGDQCTFAYRKQITIQASQVIGSSDHYNFPLLVRLSGDWLKTTDEDPTNGRIENDDGYDIIFRDSNGMNQLDHEIEDYDGSASGGTLVAWVRIPTLSYDEDTVIYMYYGNPCINSSTANVPGVWDGHYVGVWHLKEDPSGSPPQMLDSASTNGNNGTSGGSMSSGDHVEGQIDGSLHFSGDDDYIEVGTTGWSASEGTVEVWAKTNGHADDGWNDYIFGHTTQPSMANRIQLYLNTNYNQTLALGIGDTHELEPNIYAFTTGQWYHVVLTWDGTNYEVFVDSVSKADGTYSGLSSIHTFTDIGNNGEPTERDLESWNGIIDEVRVSDTPRLASWIQTEYNNQKENSTFYIEGDEEDQGDCSYAFYKEITIESDEVMGTSDLIDFPLLISISSDNDLRTTTYSGSVENEEGYDIIFKDSFGRKLDHEIEDYGPSSGKFVAWVRIPTLDHDDDTVIYMYYGNGCISSSQENAAGVWDDNYRAVWHLADTPDTDGGTDEILDSNNSNHGDSQNMVSGDQVSGRIDGSLILDGSNDYVEVPDDNSLDVTNVTLSAWVKSDTTGRYIIAKDPPDIETLRPMAVGDETYIASVSGVTDHWDAVDEATADDGGTYVYTSATDYERDLYNVTDHSAGSGTINSITVYVRAYWAGSASPNQASVKVVIKSGTGTGAPDTFSESEKTLAAKQVWEDFSNQWATNPATGAAWTWDEIDNLQIGVALRETYSGGPANTECTQVYVDVDYTPAAEKSDVPYALSTVDGGQFMFSSGATTYDVTSTTDINDSAWHYIVGTFDGSTMEIYIDGYSEDTNTDFSGNLVTNDYNVRIGADYSTTPDNYFVGTIDELRVSSIARTAEWIETEYNNQKENSTFYSIGDETSYCPTVVDLISFTATGQSSTVLVEWETAQEVDNLGFNLYRSCEPHGSYSKLNNSLIPGLISSVSGKHYTYVDEDVTWSVLYYYMLEDVDLNGTRTMHGPVCVDWDADGIPDDYDEQTDDDDSDEDTDDSPDVSVPEFRFDEVDFGAGDWIPSSSYASWVKLASFRARQGDEGVALEWETSYEIDNLGFHIYREVGGRFYRVTPDLVSGSVFQVGAGKELPAGQSYVYWDGLTEGTGSELYWLDCVELNGQHASFGPIKAEIYGQPVSERLQSRFISIARHQVSRGEARSKGRELREEMGTKSIQTQSSKASFHKIDVENPSQPRLPPSEEQWILSSLPGVKISIREDGWYRVGEPELVAAGLSPLVDPRYLQLYADGEEKSMMVTGSDDGRFDPEDAVEFYGTGLDTPFTDAHVYWLVVGSRPGRRLDTPFIDIRLDLGKRMRIPRGLRGRGEPLSFPFSLELKERTFYFAALANGEKENFFGSVISTDSVDQLLTVAHPDPSSPEDALLDVVLQGGTDFTHQVKVMLNYVEVGEVVFSGQDQGAIEIQVPHDLLLEGENIVTLTAQGGATDVSLVDYLRLTYWRTYTADEDALLFKANGGEWISVGGFSSSEIQVVDLTDPMRMINIRGKVKAQDSSYVITVKVPEAGERTLLAFTEDKIKQPAGIEANQASSWHEIGQGADIIIIAHSDLLESIGFLKELREQQGWSVKLIDVEDLYDEFNFGAKSPWALKDFLSRAYDYWTPQPRYLILVGDASYDPRGYLGYGEFDLVPAKFVDTEYLETASDDWFVDFDDDSLPEMAVGRLPVASAEEVTAVVSKIISYEGAAGMMNEALLVTDINDFFDFEGISAEVAEGLSKENLIIREIFRGRSATARSDLLNLLDQGQLLVNYCGHGSTKIWNGNLLTSSDAWNLTNSPYLPFLVSMTCLNGFFQDPYIESLAETFLKAERGGAIAVWTSSGLTFPGRQADMNLELVRLLFGGQGMTIGEAVMGAKRAATNVDIRRTWILFGDPTIRLK